MNRATVYTPLFDLGSPAAFDRIVKANNQSLASANKSLGEQLKYAGRRGIGLAAILGPDEAARGVVALKNLVTGDQIELERAEIVQSIERMLT